MDYPSQRAVGAAFFLLAKQYFPPWNGWPKNESEILLLAGVTQAEAYDARDEVLDRLYDLLWDPDDPNMLDSSVEVLGAIKDFVTKDFDAFVPRTYRGRNYYCDRFCRFMFSLLEKGQPAEGWTLEQLSTVSRVPLYALQDWQKSQQPKGRNRRAPKPWPF